MLICKNVNLSDRRTSIRLEEEIWIAVDELCRRERLTLHELSSLIDAYRGTRSLTAALRVFLIDYYRAASTDEGHARAGHGTGTGREGDLPVRRSLERLFAAGAGRGMRSQEPV